SNPAKGRRAEVTAAAGGTFFHRTSQGGIPVVQTSGDAPAWVLSADMISLMDLILTPFGELIALVFRLWLLFRATLATRDSCGLIRVEFPSFGGGQVNSQMMKFGAILALVAMVSFSIWPLWHWLSVKSASAALQAR